MISHVVLILTDLKNYHKIQEKNEIYQKVTSDMISYEDIFNNSFSKSFTIVYFFNKINKNVCISDKRI